MNRNQVLEEAKAAINRAPKSYGNPREHFERVARHWNAHLQSISFLRPVDLNLGPTDVAIMLGLVKIARLEHDPQHADSWCDLAGYAACGAEVSEPTIKPQFADGEFIPVVLMLGETLYEAMERTQRAFNAPKQEPAWKRAKVGDRIRIREGAKSCLNVPLPQVAIVAFVEDKEAFYPYKNGIRVAGKNLNIPNDDVLEILPPLPESKFGFTVGETVNGLGESPGHIPGVVTGFGADTVLVRWRVGESAFSWHPDQLRHGA